MANGEGEMVGEQKHDQVRDQVKNYEVFSLLLLPFYSSNFRYERKGGEKKGERAGCLLQGACG